MGLIQPRRRYVETSDDVIEEAFMSTATICRALSQALCNPVGVLPDRIVDSSSRNAVSFHPLAQQTVFRRPDARLQSRSFPFGINR
jgi:hypothetical protein